MPLTFEGQYLSFQHIDQYNQYSDVDNIDKIYDYTQSRYQESSYFPKPIENAYNHIRDISALTITLLCANQNHTVKVLDIGGGFAISYVELLKRCQLRNFHYSVLEIEKIFNKHRAENFFSEPNIQIINTLDGIEEKYDLLLFGSSLQYFPHYPDDIKELIVKTHQPKYVLLTHTPITNQSDFVTLQVNMNQKRVPVWIFNADNIIQHFANAGYNCIHKSAIQRDNLFDNFPKELQDYRSANMLFQCYF